LSSLSFMETDAFISGRFYSTVKTYVGGPQRGNVNVAAQARTN
jgi:hypothetical protein